MNANADEDEVYGTNRRPLDEWLADAFKALNLPTLGGPSGKGWSYWRHAQACPYLFTHQSLIPASSFTSTAMEIGSLYHTLQALAEAAGREWILYRQGLLAPEFADRLHVTYRTVAIPESVDDQLLAWLKEYATGIDNVVGESERIFRVHRAARESDDIEPIAIEWLGTARDLDYTCRYDLIARTGPQHVLGAGKMLDVEYKTTSRLDYIAERAWLFDGQILGQIMVWEDSLTDLFGELEGVIVDVITKHKTPTLRPIPILPRDQQGAVCHHRTALRDAQYGLAQNARPARRLTACVTRYGLCSLFDHCASGVE